jgi:hypothetical protein
MTEYSADELRDIIAAGEAKLDELVGQLSSLDDDAEGDVLFGVIDGLEDRLWELRNELQLLEEQEAQYELDRAEAIGLYVEEGGALDDSGVPLDDGLFCDVFAQMQEERLENSLL